VFFFLIGNALIPSGGVEEANAKHP